MAPISGAHVTDRAFAGTAHGRRAFANDIRHSPVPPFTVRIPGDKRDHIHTTLVSRWVYRSV